MPKHCGSGCDENVEEDCNCRSDERRKVHRAESEGVREGGDAMDVMLVRCNEGLQNARRDEVGDLAVQTVNTVDSRYFTQPRAASQRPSLISLPR